jgi:mgtE-like transporter
MLRRLRLMRRLLALVRADPAGVRSGFVAHLLATSTGLAAGLTLGAISGTLEQLPGLLVLVPAAVGLRGNVFGALSSRLGTLVATGTFRVSRRRDTEVGQNLWASVALSLSVSLALAFIAKGVAESFGVRNAIGIEDFIVVSIMGALLPTVVVLVITVGVAALGMRRDWDIDNVSVPTVTAAGDVITLPSLFLATYLVRDLPDWAPAAIAIPAATAALVAVVVAIRSHLSVLRRIVRESLPFLLLAGIVSTLAGVTIQSRFDALEQDPALLIVIPPLLSLAGSLAGILSARISTKMHLGVLEPSRFSVRPIAEDITLVFLVALPTFLVLGIAADVLAAVVDLQSPGVVEMIGLMLIAGLLATTLACVVAYLAGFVTYRLGWDPDNNGIPLVSSASDFLGAAALTVSIALLGLG